MEQIGFEFTFTPKHDTRLMSADELYDEISQQIAVDIDEKHNIEGKSARYGAKELGDCFLCGLIFPSGGVIVVGVENDGQLGPRLVHSQKARAVASATPERKLAASLS
jgi:hypothetical protein